MPGNFSSNNNDMWKIDSSNLVMNSSKLKLNKKKKQDETFLQEPIQEIVLENSFEMVASLKVEPNDDIDLPMISRFLYVGKNGYVSFLDEENETKTIFARKDSSFYNLRIKRILFTNTSASSIIVLF